MEYIRMHKVEAEPMTRGDYNARRVWKVPENDNPADEGYKVTYPDGYVSWCPKAQFETNAYTTDEGTSFDSVPDAHMVHDILQIFHDHHYCRRSPGTVMGRLTEALVGAYYTQFVHNPRMTFGDAIEAMKRGHKVARAGWNGKGMWICIPLVNGPKEIPATGIWGKPNAEYAERNGGTVTVMPYITMKNADGCIVMGWLASQTDMLSEDWHIVD